MVIRPLTLEDIPQLASMLDQFQQVLGLNIPPDLASVRKNFELYASMGTSVMLVAEQDGKLVGTIMAVGYPYPLNEAYIVGEELFWWVSPEHRGGSVGLRLATALESAAKEKGWHALSMCAALGSDSCSAVERFYRRNGFTESDHKFWKEFNHAV